MVSLYKFNSFEELYKTFDKVCLGYNLDDDANPKDMEQYYSLFKQDKYGVLAIEIKLI